jgi:hypothetical protein
MYKLKLQKWKPDGFGIKNFLILNYLEYRLNTFWNILNIFNIGLFNNFVRLQIHIIFKKFK